jgi:Mg2+ and Co2+ transporter CorA
VIKSTDVYSWSKFNIFTRWTSDKNQTGILVFDNKSHPFTDIIPDEHLLTDPFWVYLYILESVSEFEDRAVWSIRNLIRPIEKGQKQILTKNERPKPNYRELHDIARHSIHVTETLDVALQTIERILENHRANMSPTNSSTGSSPGLSTPFPPFRQDRNVLQEIQSSLSFSQSYLSSLRHRSIANEKRLQNEIQLTFQTVARHDALVLMDDSAALKTLAFVTFTFLPPTFICAMFSMSFFNYDQNLGWRVSGKFWIYWVLTVPTTILSAALWFYWQRNPPSRKFGDRIDTFSRGLDGYRESA